MSFIVVGSASLLVVAAAAREARSPKIAAAAGRARSPKPVESSPDVYRVIRR